MVSLPAGTWQGFYFSGKWGMYKKNYYFSSSPKLESFTVTTEYLIRFSKILKRKKNFNIIFLFVLANISNILLEIYTLQWTDTSPVKRSFPVLFRNNYVFGVRFQLFYQLWHKVDRIFNEKFETFCCRNIYNFRFFSTFTHLSHCKQIISIIITFPDTRSTVKYFSKHFYLQSK